jgi:hypothetical protein
MIIQFFNIKIKKRNEKRKVSGDNSFSFSFIKVEQSGISHTICTDPSRLNIKAFNACRDRLEITWMDIKPFH